MEKRSPGQFKILGNPGIISEQLLSPDNSGSRRVTITRVTVDPGSTQSPHCHETSEQVWLALLGNGMLLLDRGQKEPFQAGELVRFADGDVHGLENTGEVPFVYLSVTAPPIDFSYAYADKK